MKEISQNQVLPFYRRKEHQNANQGLCSGVLFGVLSPQNKLPNFQLITDYELPEETGVPSPNFNGRLFYIKNALTNASVLYMFEGLEITKYETTNGKFIYNYIGVNLSGTLPCGLYYVTTYDGEFYSDYIQVSDNITHLLKWKNTTDLFDTMYQTGGYENTLYFANDCEDSPINDVSADAIIDGTGNEFLRSVRHVYKRQFVNPNIMDSQLSAFFRINSHDTKTLIQDYGKAYTKTHVIKGVDFNAEPTNNGCRHKGNFALTLDVEIKDNCEQNIYTLV